MSKQSSTLIALVSVLSMGGCATVNSPKDTRTARHCEELETHDTRVQQSSPAHSSDRPELAFHDHHQHHPPTAGASPHYLHGASTYQLAHGDIHDAYVDPTLACYSGGKRSERTPLVPEPVTSM